MSNDPFSLSLGQLHCRDRSKHLSPWANSSITLNGIGLRVLNTNNVIIRNLKIQKGQSLFPRYRRFRVLTTSLVLASAGDAIGIQNSANVWVDHVDLSSDRSQNKDYVRGRS